MTKDEFRDGIQHAIKDMADPNGEFGKIMNEGREIAAELSVHDPVLGQKMLAIFSSIEDFGAYIRTRGEGGVR